MGFQMRICSILRFSWSILVKCCVHLRMTSIKVKYWLFYKRFIAFTCHLCGLLSFVCHSQTVAKIMKLLRRPISASDQIPDRFCAISMEVLSVSSRRSSSRNVTQWRWTKRNICLSQARILDATSKIFPDSLTWWDWILNNCIYFKVQKLVVCSFTADLNFK